MKSDLKSALMGAMTGAIIAVVIVLTALTVEKSKGDRFVAGRAYVVTTILENPFESPIVDTIFVIDKRDGYIKYKDINEGYIMSRRETLYDKVEEFTFKQTIGYE